MKPILLLILLSAGAAQAVGQTKQWTKQWDDTLTTNAVGTFYNAAGNATSSICPTGVGTRFTGEN